MATKTVKSSTIVNQVRISCDTSGCIKAMTASIPAPGLPETEAYGFAAAIANRQGWEVRAAGSDACPDHA